MKIAPIHYRLILRGGPRNDARSITVSGCRNRNMRYIIVAKSSGEVTLPEGVQPHILSPGLMPKVFRQRYFDHLLGRFMRHNHFDKARRSCAPLTRMRCCAPAITWAFESQRQEGPVPCQTASRSVPTSWFSSAARWCWLLLR